MTVYKLAEAAELLGVSDDTVRRWAEAGRFPTSRTHDGHAGIEGVALAELARAVAEIPSRRVRGCLAPRQRPQPSARHRHRRQARHRDGPG